MVCLPEGEAVDWRDAATLPVVLVLLHADELEPGLWFRPGEAGGLLGSRTVRLHFGHVGFCRSHWGFNPAGSCEASGGAAAGRGWAGQERGAAAQCVSDILVSHSNQPLHELYTFLL